MNYRTAGLRLRRGKILVYPARRGPRCVMNKTQTLSFHRRNLPHWYVANKTYFVTFCLKGAIPLTVLNKLRIELNVFVQTHPSEKELDDFHRRSFIKVEKFLDTAVQSPGETL